MPLLYYWRPDNYRRDLDYGAGYHLNQANALLHQIESGDSLWAFTRNRAGRYVLAMELVVKAKTQNPPDYRYGQYRLWGDLERSRYFEVDNQPGIEQVIRQLSVTVNARYLGQSFQGHAAVRQLTAQDHAILAALATDLPLESRAHILPEEELEAALLLDDAEKVRELILRERPGVMASRQAYLYQQAPTRNRKLINELQGIYSGKCQVCLWAPHDLYGRNLCHGHHIHWLSRGGADELNNLMLLCPNHHAAVHQCDAPFDFALRAYVFDDHRETVQLDLHLEL
ncbi:MAG: HNH endonuclease [Anaerolineales bacterium]|nr:HNH endonuclease [Anaerolineales bacterium]MCB0031274.1 HNH endonuclease [Anaerolineales bacterium]